MYAQAQAQGREPIVGHFDPDFMLTYQKEYRGRSVHHLVYRLVKESWYGEWSQICHSAHGYVPMLTLMC